MSASWSQGGQPGVQTNQRSTNPPPTCFNCGIEGHFVVDCPESQQRQTPAAFAPPANGYQQSPAAQTSWPPPAGPPQNQYASYPAAQQYGPQTPAPQYNYSQPQQQYNAPPPNSQYSRPPYQAPAPQYVPAPGPPHYGGQGYPASHQSYGPPAAASYQQPLNNYPQNTNFGGNFPGQRKSFSAQYPTSKWNDSQTASRQNLPRQQRSNSGYQAEYSNTQNQQLQRQNSHQPLPRPQSQGYGLEGSHQNQQTSASNHGGAQQALVQGLHLSPTKAESKAASIASTPHLVDEAAIARDTGESSQAGPVSGEPKEHGAEEQEEKPEEGEIGPEDDAEEAFQWDYEHAFEDLQPKETVALAQPLSASFKSTPVPLIQAWSTTIASISRYARKDNLAEYVRTIRSSPQWSYLQEDPAFADSELEGELIPFDDVPAWMAARHGMMEIEESEPEWDYSRKRSRDNDEEGCSLGATDDQEDIVGQGSHEVADESEADGPRTKRQKHENSDGFVDEVMEEARSIGTPGTMVVIPNARGGTPCLANSVDDAWAPEPGERATSPPDPTEALLASLGVSGDAKPVKLIAHPSYEGGGEESQSRQASQTPVGSQPSTSFPPAKIQQNHGTSSNQGYPMANEASSNQGQPMSSESPINGPQTNGPPFNQPPMNSMPLNNGYVGPSAPHGQYGPPVNTGYSSGAPVHQSYQGGPPPNSSYPSNAQYGPPINGAYGSGPPIQPPYAQPPYGSTHNAPYSGPPNNYSQGPQYGPPGNLSYGNAPPMNGPQAYSQFGPPAPYTNGPPQGVPYSQPQYGPPAIQPYGNAPPVNYPQGPQYGSQPYGNAQQMPNSYVPNTQMSPTQYGPPQAQSYPPHGYQQPYVSGPAPQFANGPQNNLQYATGPVVQIPFNNVANGNAPMRQDSGYFSARGSYSNGPGPNGFNSQNGVSPQGQQNPNGISQPPNEFNNQNGPPQQGQNGNTQGPPPENSQNGVDPSSNVKNEQSQPIEQPTTRENSSGDPGHVTEKDADSRKKKNRKDMTLSDLEKELLGELDPTPTRKNPLRKAATKKPQPIVEAAYSRRW